MATPFTAIVSDGTATLLALIATLTLLVASGMLATPAISRLASTRKESNCASLKNEVSDSCRISARKAVLRLEKVIATDSV